MVKILGYTYLFVFQIISLKSQKITRLKVTVFVLLLIYISGQPSIKVVIVYDTFSKLVTAFFFFPLPHLDLSAHFFLGGFSMSFQLHNSISFGRQFDLWREECAVYCSEAQERDAAEVWGIGRPRQKGDGCEDGKVILKWIFQFLMALSLVRNYL